MSVSGIVLEEVNAEHPVLLNAHLPSPFGYPSFEPVLIDGKALLLVPTLSVKPTMPTLDLGPNGPRTAFWRSSSRSAYLDALLLSISWTLKMVNQLLPHLRTWFGHYYLTMEEAGRRWRHGSKTVTKLLAYRNGYVHLSLTCWYRKQIAASNQGQKSRNTKSCLHCR